MKNTFTKAISLLCIFALILSIGIAPYSCDEPESWAQTSELNINL